MDNILFFRCYDQLIFFANVFFKVNFLKVHIFKSVFFLKVFSMVLFEITCTAVGQHIIWVGPDFFGGSEAYSLLGETSDIYPEYH